MGKHEHHTPATAASGIEDAIQMLEGRWKLISYWVHKGDLWEEDCEITLS